MDLIITLIIIGLILFIVETIFIPGVGVAGILGVVSLIASTYLAWVEYGLSTGLIVASINLVLIIILLIVALRSKLWKRFELKTNIESKVEAFKPGEIQIGQKGKTRTRLAPMGIVLFDSKSIECKSVSGIIDAGVDVEVSFIQDNQVIVKAIITE